MGIGAGDCGSAGVAAQFGYAVARKALDAARQGGDQAIELIKAAAQIAAKSQSLDAQQQVIDQLIGPVGGELDVTA